MFDFFNMAALWWMGLTLMGVSGLIRIALVDFSHRGKVRDHQEMVIDLIVQILFFWFYVFLIYWGVVSFVEHAF